MAEPGTESHDNPFLSDGDLSKKAESIIRHSTISRTELKIYDPDKEPPPSIEEPLVAAQNAPSQQSAPPTQNGSVEEPLTPKSVEVEVSNTEKPQEQKAEEVKVDKGKKCKCCVLQ